MDRWASENGLVQTDVVEVEKLAEFLAGLHGRERHEYLPYAWEQQGGNAVGDALVRITHYLVISWKCRG